MTDELTLTDGQRLLRRILECPEDNAPRLIYSDWLEEQGEEERARFIRRQVLKDHSPAKTFSPMMFDLPDQCWNSWQRGGGHSAKWVWTKGSIDSGCEFVIERGFISSVSLTCEAFVGGQCTHIGQHHGDICDGGRIQSPNAQFTQDCRHCGGTGRIEGVARELFSRHPITSVTLTNRKPRRSISLDSDTNETFDWWEHDTNHPADSSDLPAELFAHLEGIRTYEDGELLDLVEYQSESSANAALSRACVSYGRSLVGLPMLERE